MQIHSLSGKAMEIKDSDLALIVISEVRARRVSDIRGNAVVGLEVAHAIRQALRDEGFEIVRHDAQRR